MTTLDFTSFRPGVGPVVGIEIDDEEASERISAPAGAARTRARAPVPSFAESPFTGSKIAALQREHGPLSKDEIARLLDDDPILERRPFADPFDPMVGKWGVIVLREDIAEAREALEPLVELRTEQGIACSGGLGPPGVIVLDRPAADTPSLWEEALREATPRPPHHMMLLGGPDRFPFEVVRAWNARRIVGVLDVADDPTGPLSFEAVRRYAEKVCRSARGALPVDRKALVYAFRTDKATRRSYDKLAAPFLDYLTTKIQRVAPGTSALSLMGDAARTGALRELLRTERPALVLTCTHGIEYPDDPRLWGALTGSDHGEASGAPLSIDTFTDPDAFAQGAVVFAFACFSAGIPAKSALIGLVERGREDPLQTPRIAPLPRLLLGRETGPLAFIGHVDRASTSAFDGFDGFQAFQDLAEFLLSGTGTVGQAMSTFWEQALVTEAELASKLDPDAVTSPQQKVAAWIRHHDAMGWLLLGDPCAQLSPRGREEGAR